MKGIKEISIGEFSTVTLEDTYYTLLDMNFARKWYGLLKYMLSMDYIGEMDTSFELDSDTIENETGQIVFTNNSVLTLEKRAIKHINSLPSIYLIDANLKSDFLRSALLTDKATEDIVESEFALFDIVKDINAILGQNSVVSDGTNIIPNSTENQNKGEMIEYLTLLLKECQTFAKFKQANPDVIGVLLLFGLEFHSVKTIQKIAEETKKYNLSHCIAIKES